MCTQEFEATEATPTDTTPTDTTPTAPVSAHPKRRKAEGLLSAACQEAQDATHKAFALADASARTVVDVVRVLLLGMATRWAYHHPATTCACTCVCVVLRTYSCACVHERCLRFGIWKMKNCTL